MSAQPPESSGDRASDEAQPTGRFIAQAAENSTQHATEKAADLAECIPQRLKASHCLPFLHSASFFRPAASRRNFETDYLICRHVGIEKGSRKAPVYWG